MKRRLIIVILLIGLVFVLTGCYHDVSTRTDFVMDTVATITVYGTKDQTPIDSSLNIVRSCDSKWNAFDAESEISKINANAGKSSVIVSDDTYNLIKAALQYCESTDGALDITIGPVVNLWKIEEPETKEPPNADSIQVAKDKEDYHNVRLNDEEHSVFLTKPGMAINLGAVAKGAAADQVKANLENGKITRAVINLGGNVILIGKKNFVEDFRVQVEDPFNPDEKSIGTLSLKDKSIVTSGDYRRFFTDSTGKRYHHIFDSRTGCPADNDLHQVTIIGEKSFDCDALSTALFVMGSEKAKKYAMSHHVSAILVTKNREIFVSTDLKNCFETSPAEMNGYHILYF